MKAVENGLWESKRRIAAAQRCLALAVIVALGALLLLPLAWMLAISLKSPENVFQLPPWNVDWRWSNCIDAWYPYGRPRA